MWGAPLSPDSCVSQLLQGSDVEFHPDEGEEIEEKPHQGVQASVLPAGSHRREAPRSDLPRAQPLRERALEMAQGVRSPRRGSIYRKAALWQRSPRGEDRRAGAFLRTALPGEPDPKKVAKENAVVKRHIVIE